MIARIAALLPLIFVSYNAVVGQCSFPDQLPIRDLATGYSYLRIDNAANDDLASPGQGICKIDVKFTHENIGDITLLLSAPNGRVYTLIKQGGSRSTRGTTWDIDFVRCGQKPAPDQGNFIKPVWDSDQDWGENKTYSGSYHAETCLEDINTGPVNGIWTLIVNDLTGTAVGVIESFSISFCDSGNISCSDCVRAGGTITRDTVRACGGEANLGAIRIFPTYTGLEPDPSEYAYQFVVIGAGKILDITRLPDLQNAPAGDYIIYGISVANQDLATLTSYIGQSFGALTNALNAARLGFCATFSSGFKVYRILSDPNSATQVTKFVCREAPIMFDGNLIVTPGVYDATFVSSSGCDSAVQLTVIAYDISTPILDPGVISCTNKPLTLSWNNNQFATAPAYQWMTKDGSILSGSRSSNAQIDLPGTYVLAISKDGCSDTISIDVNSDGSLPTLLVNDIVMDCSANIGQLRPTSDATSFSWTGPFGYASNDQNIDVTEPGPYTITAVGSTCAVRKTVLVGADFDRPLNILVSGGAIRCENDSVRLKASSTTPGVVYLWSGPNGFTSTASEPWVNQAGIYTVSVGAPGSGCAEKRNVEVFSLFKEPSISLTGAVLDCSGASKRITTTVSDNLATFSWTGPNGFTSAEKSPLVSMPGTYVVVVSDANQCAYLASATVSVDTIKPTVSASDITLGCMDENFMLAATYTSLHPATFSWSGPNDFSASDLNAVATQSGTYTIRVTDPVNGCSAISMLEVIPDLRKPVVTTIQRKLNCDQDQDTLIAVANCAGGCLYAWDGPNGFSDTNDSIVVRSAGDYQVKVTDVASTCFSWATITVTNDTVPIAPNVSVVPIGCTTDGSVSLTNASQFREFQWVDTATNEISTTSAVTSSTPSVFTLQTIDKNGCLASNQRYQVEVQDDVPQVTILSDSINCTNDSVPLRISISNYALGQVATYTWALQNNQASNKANPRVGAPGEVRLQIVMKNGCRGDVVGEVGTDFADPVLDAIGGSFACRDTGVFLQLNADRVPLSTYWTGPNGFQSYQASPLVSVPGIYQLQIQGANGCAGSDTALVSYSDPLPMLEVFGDTVTCLDTAGNLSFLTDAMPGFTYRWLDPGGRINLNQTIATTLVGPYQLELIDTNGCRAIAAGRIDVDTVSFGATISSEIISCLNASTTLELDSVLTMLQYQWLFDSSMIADVPQPTVDSGGLYTLITTNVNGCQRSISHIVEADTIRPLFDLLSDTLDCENNKINARPVPVQGGVSYEWLGPGDYHVTGVNALVTQPGQYTLVGTGLNGCQRTESMAIEASFELPTIMIDSTFLPCTGDSADLSFQTLDQLRETNWFGPDGFYQSTQTSKTLTAGTYYLLAKGLNGCEAFDSQFVSAVPLLDTLVVTAQKIDCGHPVGFVRIENVLAGFEYSITDQSNMVVMDTELQTTEPNNYFIQAIHLESSCPITKTVMVPVDTFSPELTILERDSIVCDHREITLGSMVDDTVIYQWSTTNGQLIGVTDKSAARLDMPGLYNLNVQSLTNSCEAGASFLVEEKFSNLTAMFLRGSDAGCLDEDDAALIIDSLRGGTGPYQFSLNDEFYTLQNVFNYLSPGQYQVYVQDVNGCQYDTLIDLGRIPKFGVDLGEKDRLLDLGDSLDLNVETDLRLADISEIIWYLPDSLACQDCFTQTIRPVQNTTYQVAIQSTSGCVIKDTILVRVADRPGLFIPNAFTPNGDQINDFTEVFVGSNIQRIAAFEIFDRWGNNVFSASNFLPGDMTARWDGTYQGEPLNPGVYIYVVQATDIRGVTKTASGDITLLR